MRAVRNRYGWWRVLPRAAAAMALFLLPWVQRGETRAPAVSSKLTTILAELARSVPQEQGRVPARRAANATGLSTETLPQSVRDAMRHRLLRINSNAEAQVYILMSAVTEENLSELKANGVAIEIVDASHRRVQARVPVTRLQLIAELPFVNFIRLPSYARAMTGSVETEGDAILHSDQVRQQLKVDGAGVRVGVISDGLKGVFAANCTACAGALGGPISTGDLPSATGVRNASGVLTSSSGGITGTSFHSKSDLEGIVSPCGFAGAGAEGTALLEIVHDIAPSAQLSFANADTDLAFEQAVNFLASSNDVVMDDLGFFGEASDGTSPVSSNTAAALNNSSNPIRAYLAAVGNASDEHYFGSYLDSGVDGSTISGVVNSGHLHLFQQSSDTTDVLGLGPQPFNVIKLPTNGEAVIVLTWNDPFGAATNNYDLYLVQESTGRVVRSSTDNQNGKQDPLEAIDYVNTGNADNFHIVIQNVQNRAQTKNLNLFSFQPECALAGPARLAPPRHERHNYNTAARSVPAESDAGGSPVSVLSVGAICSASAAAQSVFSLSAAPDESCFDTSNSTIEFFSSQGPTLDGRTKPEITGIDGVSVTGAGGFENPFFGTSAATPHLAGIAALLLQSAPCLLDGAKGARDNVTARTNLRNLVLDNAASLGGSVPNNIFGFGRANALASANQTLPVFAGPSALTVSGNVPGGASLTAGQIGFTDPNACPLATMNWTGGCGTGPAPSLNCPIGTSSLSVMASNNGVAFSPAANVRIVVTDFSVSVSPGSAQVTAGQSANYQVTVLPRGGPFSNSITLGCSNLPPATSCSFNPAAVAPGAASAQSVLTVSTTARSAAPPSAGAPLNLVMRWAPSFRLHRDFFPTNAWLALMALTLLVLAGLRFATRRIDVAMGAASIGLTFFAFQMACGGGGGPPPAPSVSLSPTSLTFSSQIVQTSSRPQQVALTNTGNGALTITGISASGDFAESNNCGGFVAAGGNCAVSVTFAPTASGTRNGTLSVSDNAFGSPQTVSLTGTGRVVTPAGNFSFNITGTSGTLVESGQATLVVQ